jgi:hypothetical protein
VQPGARLDSNRVDIGAFVYNGHYYSAPGFICFQYLANEKRIYDDQHRIQVIDYTDPELKDNYVDPLIDYSKNWRDEYHWSDDGKLLGWTRIRGEERQEFTADGELVVEQDADGEPRRTAKVEYVAEKQENGTARLKQVVAE